MNFLGLNKEKAELKKRIGKYSDSLKRTVLKSPVSGIIKLISVNSKGAIVAPGVTVAEIVPEDEKLIIEAKITFIRDWIYICRVRG